MAIRIERDGKLVNQSIVSTTADKSFSDLISQVMGSVEIETIYAGSKSLEKEHLFELSLTTTIDDAILAIGSCTKVLCILKSMIPLVKKPLPSAFDTLMNNASILKRPDKRSENRGQDGIYNHTVDYLQDLDLGFRTFQKVEMELFMSTVVSVLWYLDGHWEKFSSAPGVSKMPQRLHFAPENQDTFRKLHHGDQKKKTLPRLKKLDLIEHFNKLEFLSSKSFIQAAAWRSVLDDVCQLKVCIAEYIAHINRAEVRGKAEEETISHRDNRSLKKVPAKPDRKNMSKILYAALETELESAPPYVEHNVVFFCTYRTSR